MIQLHSDALWFHGPQGHTAPYLAEVVALELGGLLDPEMVAHAAQAVLHYFRTELGRSQVSVGEFAETLAAVLRGLGLNLGDAPDASKSERLAEADLRRLACETGGVFELGFFSRLRGELRRTLRHSPRLVRFQGLRGCVKELTGARRWNRRCQRMNDQIVDYLRRCLAADGPSQPCALVVV